MKYQRYKNNYLYEGLDYSASQSMMLWESAGFKLKEAALTADQIQQIFQNVEQGATAAGGNRTVLGKGKDAAVAVNKAWEDLKTKIQNSGPIAKVDSAYDSAVSKIEAGLGGPDNAINKVIQKYRKFAKDYPVAQGFIYAALIAAAGISGAGLGGAAVLGLLKMTDKLLQGEKFSSAAYAGAKTGATAYGASKLGDLIKGKPAGGGGLDPNDPDVQGTMQDIADTKAAAAKLPGGSGTLAGGEPVSTATGVIKAAGIDKQTAAALQSFTADPDLSPIAQKLAGDLAAGKNVRGGMDFLYKSINAAAREGSMLGDMPDGTANAGLRKMMSLQRLASLASDLPLESISHNGKKLSEGQIYMIFNRVSEQQQLTEGPMDFIKGAAAKGMAKLQTVGKNLTTKVTADKLNSAWKKAGSPMDSEEVAAILKQAGVGDDVVGKVYTDLKLPAPGAAPSAGSEENPNAAQASDSSYAEIKKSISQLNTKDRQRMIQYLTKQIGTA